MRVKQPTATTIGRKKNQQRELKNMIDRRDHLSRMIIKKQLDIEEQEW